MSMKVESPIVFLVDDDLSVLKTLPRTLEHYGFNVTALSSATEFLEVFNGQHGCLVLDLSMPQMNGLELQQELNRRNLDISIIFITGHGGVSESVKALRAGAIDFLEKPFSTETLVRRINEAINLDFKSKQRIKRSDDIRLLLSKLTEREFEIFEFLIETDTIPPSKVIAKHYN